MKIDRPSQEILDTRQIRQALEALLRHPGPQQVAPCQHCQRHIPSQCSADCKGAQSALSSEPQQYPLEKKTVPLIFEIAASGIAQPFWSCEGHLDQRGRFWKIPQVSFYVAAPVYAQLLQKYVTNLHSEKCLTYPWHVVVSDYGELNGVSYTLEPRLYFDKDPHLGRLQHDMMTMAEGFSPRIKSLTQRLMDQLPEDTPRKT